MVDVDGSDYCPGISSKHPPLVIDKRSTYYMKSNPMYVPYNALCREKGANMVEFDRWEGFGFALRLLINVPNSFAGPFEFWHPQKFYIDYSES